MKDEKEVWGCARRRTVERKRRAMGERNSRLPGLQSSSVILCVSHPILRLRRRYSICANESIYTHTLAQNTIFFKPSTYVRLPVASLYVTV